MCVGGARLGCCLACARYCCFPSLHDRGSTSADYHFISRHAHACQVPYYEYALDMILDNEPPADVMLTDQQHEMLENAAEMLYGLIHARYLVTARGLCAMMEKFKNCDFGRCPR